MSTAYEVHWRTVYVGTYNIYKSGTVYKQEMCLKKQTFIELSDNTERTILCCESMLLIAYGWRTMNSFYTKRVR